MLWRFMFDVHELRYDVLLSKLSSKRTPDIFLVSSDRVRALITAAVFALTRPRARSSLYVALGVAVRGRLMHSNTPLLPGVTPRSSILLPSGLAACPRACERHDAAAPEMPRLAAVIVADVAAGTMPM